MNMPRINDKITQYKMGFFKGKSAGICYSRLFKGYLSDRKLGQLIRKYGTHTIAPWMMLIYILNGREIIELNSKEYENFLETDIHLCIAGLDRHKT